jgi:hypothetical protein
MGNRDKMENTAEIRNNFLGNLVIHSYQDNNCKALVDPDRKAIELGLKSIFACPHFSDFFQNQEEIRMK